MNASGRLRKPIVTEIVEFSNFYRAEDYHQDYYKKTTSRYESYRFHSGRNQFFNFQLNRWYSLGYAGFEDMKEVWPVLLGCSLVYLGKLWFIDRMLWLYEDMKDVPEYRKRLR